MVGTLGHDGDARPGQARSRRGQVSDHVVIQRELRRRQGPGFVYKARLGDSKPPLDYRN